MCMANLVLVEPGPRNFATYCKSNGLRRYLKCADLENEQLGCSGRLRSTFIVCSDDIKCHFWNEIAYWQRAVSGWGFREGKGAATLKVCPGARSPEYA